MGNSSPSVSPRPGGYKSALILSNSVDGTADALVSLMGGIGIRAFRWNIDLWEDYELALNDSGLLFSGPIQDPIYISATSTKLIWRKPFVEYITKRNESKINEEDIVFLRNQTRAFLQEISAYFRSKQRLFIDPISENIWPKLKQLSLAKNYFPVPNYDFSFRKPSAGFTNSNNKFITKPLGNPSVGKDVFYTKQIDPSGLERPFPWFLQEAIVGGRDATAVFIDETVRLFLCHFNRDEKNLDWRVEINSELQSPWEQVSVPTDLHKQICEFMRSMGLRYGRLDFIKIDNNYLFLECNINGQFGWLDNENLSIHKDFLSAAMC